VQCHSACIGSFDWIKQALTDYGNELINGGRSSNNELGFIYKNSASEIVNAIDSQIGEGNIYSNLNRKYADYMNKKDAITSTFGKPQYWGKMGGTPQLTKGMPAAMEIANTLKSGQPITSEALQAMNQEFQGLSSMITLMKNSGLENDAKALESGLYELSDALTSVENVKAAKKQFDLMAKTDPELAQASPIFDQYLKKIKGKETYSPSPYKQKQSELMDVNTRLINERQALRGQKTELDKERIRRARELKLSNDGIAITSTAGVMSQFLPTSVRFPIRAAATIYQIGKNQSLNVVPILEKMRNNIINKIAISNVANRQNLIKSVNAWFDHAIVERSESDNE
jgi:hypothetical protein